MMSPHYFVFCHSYSLIKEHAQVCIIVPVGAASGVAYKWLVSVPHVHACGALPPTYSIITHIENMVYMCGIGRVHMHE